MTTIFLLYHAAFFALPQLVAILEELLEVTKGPDAPVELEAIASKLKYMGMVKGGYSPL